MSYISENGQVLMIKKFEREEDPNSGFYTLPGGKLEGFEKGRNIAGRLESAVRETMDETGIKLVNPFLKGIVLFDNSERVFENWKNPQDFLVYIFSAESYTGKMKVFTREGLPEWANDYDIPNLPKNSGDRRMYEWLKDGRNFMSVIKHKEKEIDEEGTFVDFFNSQPYW